MEEIVPSPGQSAVESPSFDATDLPSWQLDEPLCASSTTPPDELKAPLVRLDGRDQNRPRRFKVLQQWEGVVVETGDDFFVADLLDLTDTTKAREIAEIPLAEISEDDQELLSPGCVFYWIIGYETSRGGQKSRVSEIRVRRNPKWTKNEIEAIREKGKALFRQFAGEDDPAGRK